MVSGAGAEGDPVTGLCASGQDMVLTLKLTLGRSWKPVFTFTLLPVGLQKVDVLEAQLRDALEKVDALEVQLRDALGNMRSGSEVVFMSVTAGPRLLTITEYEGVVTWDGVAPTDCLSPYIKLSDDKTQISVLRPGVYHFYFTPTDGGMPSQMHLRLNRKSISIGRLHVIVKLTIDDVIDMCYIHNLNSMKLTLQIIQAK